jgi:hypothetical protein
MIGSTDMKARFPNPLRVRDGVWASSVIDAGRIGSKPGRGIVEETSELVSQRD